MRAVSIVLWVCLVSGTARAQAADPTPEPPHAAGDDSVEVLRLTGVGFVHQFTHWQAGVLWGAGAAATALTFVGDVDAWQLDIEQEDLVGRGGEKVGDVGGLLLGVGLVNLGFYVAGRSLPLAPLWQPRRCGRAAAGRPPLMRRGDQRLLVLVLWQQGSERLARPISHPLRRCPPRKAQRPCGEHAGGLRARPRDPGRPRVAVARWLLLVCSAFVPWFAGARLLGLEPPGERAVDHHRIVLVSSSMTAVDREAAAASALARWPLLRRHPRSDAEYADRLVLATPDLGPQPPDDDAAGRKKRQQLIALEDGMCPWSSAHVSVAFAFVETECRGNDCEHRGHVCRNEQVLVEVDATPSGDQRLLEPFGIDLGRGSFPPFERGYFAGAGVE